MNGLLNFSMAFVFVVLAVLVLMGKADKMMGKYRLTLKDGKPRFVKIRSYDAKRARPLFALIMVLLAVILVLEYVLRPMPTWYSLIALAIIVPIALYMELCCREK
jgi:hypothetical protein